MRARDPRTAQDRASDATVAATDAEGFPDELTTPPTGAGAPMPAFDDPHRWVGREIGGVRLTGLLGAGGMGAVYAGDHLRLGRPVAVKLLPKGLAREAERSERFLREARAAAKLEHPGIVTVYDVGEVPDAWFISMQLVEGESAAARVRRAGPLDAPATLAVIRAVADALDAAHRRGIVHRDVKPENVLCSTDGDVLLADFGLVRDLEAGTQLSASGQILGTPAYMSPEQARGDAVDARSDLYSLGTTAYYLATGLPPFQAETAIATALKHIMEEPDAPSEHNAALPPAFDAFVAWCMAKRPDDRPPSAAAVHAECDRLLAGGLHEPVRRAGGPRIGRGIAIGAGVGLVALLGVAGLAGAFGRGRGAARREAPAPVDPAKADRDLRALVADGRYDEARALADRILATPSAPAELQAAAERARRVAEQRATAERQAQALRDGVRAFRTALKGTEPVAAAVRRYAPTTVAPEDLEHVAALAELARAGIVWVGEPRLGALAEHDGRAEARVTMPMRRVYGPDPEAVEDWELRFVEDDGTFRPRLGGPEQLVKAAAVLWLDHMLDAHRRRRDDVLRAELERTLTARGEPTGTPAAEGVLKRLLGQVKVLLFVGAAVPGFRYEAAAATWDADERVATVEMRFLRDPTPRDPTAQSTGTLRFALRDGHWVWWGSDREPRPGPGWPRRDGKRPARGERDGADGADGRRRDR